MARLHKMVNGEKVFLTAAEEKATRDEWAANDAIVDVDTTEDDILRDPLKKITLQLLMEATGRTKDEIIQLVKDEKSTR